ncbi:hypothetical protein ACIQAA_31870 [Neobacillus sp. NPDC093182]
MLAEWSDNLALFFENYTLKILPRIGHFVPFEAPMEVLKAITENL